MKHTQLVTETKAWIFVLNKKELSSLHEVSETTFYMYLVLYSGLTLDQVFSILLH